MLQAALKKPSASAAEGPQPVPPDQLHRRQVGARPTAARPSPSATPRPASRSATVPAMGAAETRRAIEAANAALAGLARACSPRSAPRSCASCNDLMLANADDLAAIMTAEQGKPLAESQGRDRLCRELHRVVRRGRQARLRRHHPAARQGPPHRGDQGADRRRSPPSRRGTSRPR